LVEEKSNSGVYLTVLGLGTGNLQDAKMEIMADNGNGNYFYIDTENEAKKVFGSEIRGTLFTIAKDVKIQVEFNSKLVKSYRLIGYENRKMKNEDFDNDKKDAGEIGVGHTVTAIYEIEKTNNINMKDLENQTKDSNFLVNELLAVKLRYKKPDGENSNLISQKVLDEQVSFENAPQNLQFSAAVASFAMVLRKSEYKGESDYEKIVNWAKAAKGEDKEGYRQEFIELVKMAKDIDSSN